MGMSNFYRNNSLEFLNNKYLALYTSNPGYNNTGLEVNKISYARQQISVAKNLDGEYKNVGDIIFPTATEDWGIISHVAIFSEATGGDFLWFDNVKISREVRQNDQLTVSDSFIILGIE